MIKIVILNIILFFSSLMSFSQYSLPDSIGNKIKSDAPQSEKISQLKEYASELIYSDVSQGRFFIDSAIRMASRHNEEKLLNELYNNKGSYHLYAREYDSALKAYKKYLSYAIENDLPEVEQTAYSNIGVVFFRRRLSDSAIHYATKSLKLAKKIGDSASLAKTYSDLGGYYLEKDNYVKALENLSKSENYEDPDNHFEMAVLNIRQGIAYGEIEDFKKARETYMKALRNSKKQSRQMLENTIYNNLGQIYENLRKDADSALIYYNKALEYSRKADKKHDIVMLNVNIGNVHIMKENYTKAYEYCNKAYRSSLIDDMPKSKAAVLINLGNIHSHLGNVDTAYYLANKGLDMARKHGYLEFKSNAFSTLTRIDSLRGNYLSAMAYKDSLMKVDDKIWDQQLNDKIAELNVEHEVEKQKKANKLLKQKAELDQQHIRTQRILIIALVVALLFIVYVGLRLQRKKSKLQSLNELLNKKNKELADNYEELKKLNATKDKFFSIIAHDLKGPIGTQSEMLNELLEDYDNVDKEELYIYLKNLRKNGDNSYTLLLNLLDWSRSQQGRIENNPETLKVKDMVVDVYELLKPRAERKQQEMINNFEDDELFAFADKSLTNRVLYNLINNAIKFTPPGKQIRIDGRKNGDNIEIDITDEGIGIPREKIDTLFGLNNDIKRKGTEDEHGTGLGLMLCKEFADLIGGEIDVKSKEGEGSTFTFILPGISQKAGKERNVQDA